MEIHGCDFVIKSNSSVSHTLVIDLIRKHWENMVYEVDETDIFFYKDKEAKRAWDEEGWSKENDAGMICAIFDKEATQITLVIDDCKKNQYIVDDISKFISNLTYNESFSE